MKRYMLDTNTVSHLLREHPKVIKRLLAVPMTALCISAITEAELLFGLAKRPDAKRLHLAVRELLKRLDVVPWTSELAARYGVLRARMESEVRNLSALDMLIAAHAMDVTTILVSNDCAFAQVTGLQLEDWTV